MLLNATGWMLIHFLWQGAIIVAVFAMIDAAARRASARTKYAIASSAMLVMLACAVTTFVRLANMPGPERTNVSAIPVPSAIEFGTSPRISQVQEFHPGIYLPWLVYCWMAGVTMLSMRLAAQWVLLDRYRRRGIRIMDSAWQERIRRIAVRLRLRRAVRLYESALADVPSVVGWLRPVILVPASALMRLAPGQLEALLAHELAHVRRHDYLINLLQSCVETLFFYHPGVWWVGRRMREERENCCDDLAVRVCGDPVVYARALADMEDCRRNMPELAMAANGGSLLTRIERLIAPRRLSRPIAPVGMMALTLVVGAVFVWAVQAPPPKQQPNQAPTPATTANQAPKPVTPKPAPAKREGSYLEQVEKAGYRDLSVDQMIAMKIHGVDADYIAEIKSLGWSPAPDQLVAFRIHGVSAENVKEMRALGYSLTPEQAVTARVHGVDPAYANMWKQQGLTGLDFEKLVAMKIHGVNAQYIAEIRSLGWSPALDQLVAFRIHGVNAENVKEMRALGYPLTPEQAVTARVHGVDPAYANMWKQQGLTGLDFEKLVALKIHGADPAQLREIKTLGLGEISADDLVELRVAGVTPEFIRETRARGFRNLRLDQIIQLKHLGILDSKESK